MDRMNAGQLTLDLGYSPQTLMHLGALWGKSRKKAGGTMNLLISHLFDTAAVAELIWDHFLSPATKRLLDDITDGHGRAFFSWLCAVHDCGKSTPAFQVVSDEEVARVRATGLSWSAGVTRKTKWRHDKAGAKLLMDRLAAVGWSPDTIDWIWPLVGGHHGVFPTAKDMTDRHGRGDAQGRSEDWRQVQRALLDVLTRALGFPDLKSVEPTGLLSRADQLHLSGLIVMADWIASDQRFFVGIDDIHVVSMVGARDRASRAWQALRLGGGWGQLVQPEEDVVAARFGLAARPFQREVLKAARRMPAPGLLIVEAPMGEGKTEVALTTAEILAARFGADGVFVGMPTQATCDPMFSRVRRWVGKVCPGLEDRVVLLHGKSRFNPEWKALIGAAGDDPAEVYGGVGEDDPASDADSCTDRSGPSQWFLGRSRGLLAPFVVGTIDQLLYAGTRTRHVMLRMAGLAGKVVVLDEVHAADVYMSQFLHEVLRWLGHARVPVILLSATLAPTQRRDLTEAYLSGAQGGTRTDELCLPVPDRYPNITTACVDAGRPEIRVTSSRSWRKSQPVNVEHLAESADTEFVELVALLEERLVDGGCALVIRNDVERAQGTYRALRRRFGGDVHLLHGRHATMTRAERTQDCLSSLGPPDDETVRPKRMVLVATQLAEQSFDVDADLLVSDIAPIDLLLQRIGRLHRHRRGPRPPRVDTPAVVVTGFDPGDGEVPRFLGSSEFIYGRYLLLRTADLVLQACRGDGWSVPDQVPALVEQVYDPAVQVPTPWVEAEALAGAEWEAKQRGRAETARTYLLSDSDERSKTTLAGLHYAHVHGTERGVELDALVRDGPESVEVVVVRHDRHGYRTFRDVPLGADGERGSDVVDDVLGGTVRLPPGLTAAAVATLEPLPGWRRHPWLSRTRALVLEDGALTPLGGCLVSYDDDLGLVVRRPSN